MFYLWLYVTEKNPVKISILIILCLNVGFYYKKLTNLSPVELLVEYRMNLTIHHLAIGCRKGGVLF